MKKNLCILLTCLFMDFAAFAQLAATPFDSKNAAAFFQSKTFVVNTGEPAFDASVKEAMKDQWKITPYDFMSVEDFQKNITNPGYSFIVLINFDKVHTKSNGSTSYVQTYHYYGVIQGGQKQSSNYDYNDMLAYCPINFYMDENPVTNSAYRAPIMIHNLNSAIELVKEKQIKGNTLTIVKKLQEVYNSKTSVLKKKTLLMNEEHFKDMTEADIKAVYPYKFELCTKDRIIKAMKAKDKSCLIYQPGITLNKSMMVFDCETYDCVFFDYAIQGMTIKKGDLKDMVKIANKVN